ncbi:hypothetical protein Tco_0499566 [Tanacetum coccineum]
MSTLTFADTHNMVAFLEKPAESDGFHEIIDFLNANQIRYALTVNPTIYTSCIEQFWATAKVKTVNGERQLQALVDKKKVIITETSIRSDLNLEDAGGTDCLPTDTIFEELARMGYEKPSSKLTFYKAFFSPQWKFFIHTITQCLSAKTTAWNEFSSTMASAIICLATNQKFNLSKYIFDAMVKHLEGGVKFLMYPRFVQVFINQQLGDMSHHKKIIYPLQHKENSLPYMREKEKDFLGETYYYSLVTSKLQKKQSRRKQRKDIKVSQSSASTEPMTEKETNEESVPKHSYDLSQSGEDRMQLHELMNLCTKLFDRIFVLETTKTTQALEIANLKSRVKKLEKQASKRTHKFKRLYRGRSDDTEMFDTDALISDEVFTENDMTEKEHDVIHKEVSAAEILTTAGITIPDSTAEIKTSVAPSTIAVSPHSTVITAPLTIPKAKGITFRDAGETTTRTPTSISSSSIKDKGKAKMVEPEVPLNKKDQIRLDE